MSIMLVHATRGHLVENMFRGDVVAVNADHKIIFSLGEPDKKTYWRSAAKPFQVLPFIEADGMKEYGVTNSELALMCASHGGEAKHVEGVSELLEKVGFTEADLRCGSAPPMHQPSMRSLLKQGQIWSQLHNCCSGKHTAMLALAAMRNYDTADYERVTHPVQREMLQAVAQSTGMEQEKIGIGIDGCGVPIYYMPLVKMAGAYALLSQPEKAGTSERCEALLRISEAMTKNPWYVAGTDRLDTILMEVTQGKVLAKLGADGVYCVSVMNEGIGIALKIESGEVKVIDVVVVELLSRMNLISEREKKELDDRLDASIYNHRRDKIGKLETVF